MPRATPRASRKPNVGAAFRWVSLIIRRMGVWEATMQLPRALNAIFFASIVAGCSGGFGTMDGVMQSWKGAALDASHRSMGLPEPRARDAGHKLYIWQYNKSVYIPATTTATVNNIGSTSFVNATTYGGGMITGNCERTLEVNDENKIIRWQWSGNNCPFADVFRIFIMASQNKLNRRVRWASTVDGRWP